MTAMWLKGVLRRPLVKALVSDNTIQLRVFFSLVSFGWVSYILSDKAAFADHHPYVVEYMSAPEKLATLFLVYSCAIMYGAATGRFSFILLLIEGYLGVFLWMGVGIADWVQQGAPGPAFFAGLIAAFLLARYPTHYTRSCT